LSQFPAGYLTNAHPQRINRRKIETFFTIGDSNKATSRESTGHLFEHTNERHLFGAIALHEFFSGRNIKKEIIGLFMGYQGRFVTAIPELSIT
jgi:hypothetical protein